MTEYETEQLLNSGKSRDPMIERFLDEFRGGRDTRDLMSFLESSNISLIEAALYILKELKSNSYRWNILMDRIWTLTEHEDFQVRFQAICAISPFLSPDSEMTRKLLRRGTEDEGLGIRNLSSRIMNRLGLSAADLVS